MKVFLAALAIVAMIEVSLAGPLERTKRDNGLDFGQSTYTFFTKAEMNAFKAAAYAIEKMPQTEAYAPYKKELQEYVDYVQSVKAGETKTDNCFKKLFKTYEKFHDITEHYDDEDAPVEAKEVHKLLAEAVEEETAYAFANMFLSFLKLVILEENGDAHEAGRKEFEKVIQMEC